MKTSPGPVLLKKCVKTPPSPQFYLIVLFAFSLASSMAQTNTWDGSAGNGNWNTASNWSLDQVPTSAHDVVIPNGITGTINVNTAAVCSTLTINGGGTANTLSISPTFRLDVTNGITIGAGTGTGDHKLLAVGTGILTCASISVTATAAANRTSGITISTGSATVSGDFTLGSNDVITFSGAGTLNVGGNLSSGGTFTASTGTVVYDGAAGQSGGVYTYNNLTLRGAGTKTFATTPTVNGTLALEGTASIDVTTGVVTYGAAATLRYNKAAAYTVTDEEWITPFVATGGVIIANTGVISLNAAKQIGNNTNVSLNINAGATLSTSASNFGLTFHGDFINSGTLTAGSAAITIAGTTATHNIGSFTTTGTVSLTKTGGTATLTGNVNGGALTINGTGGTLNLGTGLTHNFTGDWTRTAGTLNGGTSALRIGGHSSGSGGTFTASNGTVEWYAAGTQTVADVNYNNLTFSGSGVKTLQTGTTIIGGNFILSGSASTTGVVALGIGGAFTLGAGTSFTAGAFTHTVDGAWTNNGATFNNAGSTINLNGGAQSIGGTASTTFDNLTLAGSGTKTFGVATFVAGNLSISTGVVADLSTFTTHTANALILGSAGQIAGTWGGTTSTATNINSTFFAAATGLITVATKGVTTYYSRQTGLWNAPTSWSTVTYGNATNLGTFPVAGDIVNIGGALTITVNVNSACATLNFQSAGNSPTVSINSGISLDVSGQIYMPTTSAFSGDVNTLAVGAGTLNAGSIDFDILSIFGGDQVLSLSTGTITISGDVSGGLVTHTNITFTGSGLLQLGGAMLNTLTCNFTASTGTVEYNGSVAQTMGNFAYNNLTLSSTGTKTPVEAMDINGTFTLGSGTSFTAAGYTHTLAGNWVNNGTTFDNASSTFTLDGAAQSIGGTSPTTFNNLTLAGTNTKTFAQPSTIDGAMAINSGVVANLGSITTHTARSLSLNGAGQAPGTYGSTSSTATNQNNTFFTAGTTGILTVIARAYYSRQPGNWNNPNSWSTDTYGGATNSGTFPVAGDVANIGGGDFNIAVNVNSACTSLNFQGNAANSPSVSIGSGNTLNVSGAVTIPATQFLSGDVNTFDVGAGTLNAGSLTFAAGGLFGEKAFTISSGTATISGDVTNSGVSFATITFTGNGLLRLRGDFLNSGNCDFEAGTGTVEYNGSAAQTIGDFTYYNLTLNNLTAAASIPQLSLTDDTDVENTLTMTSGVVDMNGSTLTLGVSGAASVLTRTASTTTNWLYDGSFRRFWPTGQTPSPTAGNLYGLFPLGHSAESSYRPVAITAVSNITTTGSVTFTHVHSTTATDLSPVYNDAGTNIVRKHNSTFVGTTTGLAGGTSFTVSATMTGLAAGTASDVRLAVSNGVNSVTAFGTHSANTGTAQNPTVARTGIALANLAGDYRITTTNLSATPLPIELLFFGARIDADVVRTEWATASEINNHFFTIQKTVDFENFYDAGEVEGKGTSHEMNSYTFVDDAPIAGRSYYRLKQTDFDGRVSYSEPVMINFEKNHEPVLSVYPNPTQGNYVTIQISGLPTDVDVPVQIYNLLGESVFSSILSQEVPGFIRTNVELNGRLPQGTYIVKAGKTKQLTKKLMIR